MKKVALAALVVVIAGTCAFGQTQVLSRNAVGYTKVTADRGQWELVRNDFFSLGSGVTPTPSNVFGSATMPTSTVLYVWDLTNQSYSLETLAPVKGGGLQWGPNTELLEPGRGFWLRIPSGAPSNEYSVFLMGEVPDRFTMPTSTVYILEGFNLVGYPYPVDVLWTNTELAKSANTNDRLYSWDGSSYYINTLVPEKGGSLAWGDPTQVLYVGRGYWFRRETGSGTITWDEPKPYTWP